MEKILSKEQCEYLLDKVSNQEWHRVDFHCHYDQSFVEDLEIEKTFEEYFGKKFVDRPIMKVLRLTEGDGLPMYSGDYDSTSSEAFKRYRGTNFIIETYLNEDFEGGDFTMVKQKYQPKQGHGLIQKKSNICRIDKVTQGTAYLIFCYVKGFVSNNLL